MKNFFAFLSVIVVLFFFSSCATDKPPEKVSVPVSPISDLSPKVTVWNMQSEDGKVFIDLSEQDSETLVGIIGKYAVDEGVCDCICDVTLTVNGVYTRYSSSCGTLNMIELSSLSSYSHWEFNKKSVHVTLSDEDRERFNAVLEGYVALGADVVYQE